MDESTIALLIFTSVGLLEIILGIPLLYEKIKPNWYYGFRTSKTVNNKEIWYKCNKYVGRDLIIAGIIVAIGSLTLLFYKNNFSVETIAFIGIFLVSAPVIIVLIRGFIYLKKL